jgi:P-type E1-E2 ATPase
MTIAYSSSILTPGMALSVIDSGSWEELAPQVEAALGKQREAAGKALVIGGGALATVMEHDEAAFVKLCAECNVVVCARCAPAQKAEVVTLVMKRLNKVSLAVGDGGNDVPMILSAHVGVGIAGNEGMQAARSSDYAVGEFQKLTKLLAVHGRYNNIRCGARHVCPHTHEHPLN